MHLQHGPIDLVIEARGASAEVRAALEQAWDRFQDILDALVAELPLLRSPVGAAYPLARGPVARRMVAAVWPHRAMFITPMAAVAGAVADEILAAMLAGRRLAKAYVNNGGDIAVHVAPGERLRAGIVENPAAPALGAAVELERSCGLATSGWRGRSHSLGIADAVTVLARTAARADAAATLVANAVNAEHPTIRRAPARSLREDSDLGELAVTTAVGPLPPPLVEAALDSGVTAAAEFKARGLLRSAYLALQGRTRVVQGELPAMLIEGGKQ
jgi:ApbE superfamily uncharacterized protein (UPF0280 family)